jgi:predicted DNA-binding antitoxin AbrB/MazE fold protein
MVFIMATVIKAVFSSGVLKPLERLSLREGEVVSLLMAGPPKDVLPADARAVLDRTAGAWTDDDSYWQAFERYVYDARIENSRPKPKF